MITEKQINALQKIILLLAYHPVVEEEYLLVDIVNAIWGNMTMDLIISAKIAIILGLLLNKNKYIFLLALIKALIIIVVMQKTMKIIA